MRIFLSLIASAFLVAGALRAQEPWPDTLPTLRGAEAVAQLKQNGQYESLREAVNAAQEENAQANKADSLDGFGETTKLLAPDGATDNQFGSSVAISGDTALVGAPLDNVGATYQGSVYVFIRNGTNWVLHQKLTAADGGAEDFFGASVAISGDTAVVAAVGDHTGANIYQGSAYVFVRSGTTWTQQQKLLAADGAAGDFFGTDLAVEGDTAVIGTPREDEGTTPGSAYVFVRSGTSWTLQQQLIAPNGVASDRFGSGVAISGETIVVNAVWDDVGANTDQGSAYVFVRTGSAWAPQQQLVAGDGAADEHFGSSVAISGDTAVIGAAGDNASQGSAYVFVRNGVSWTQEQKLTAADGAANDRFGYPVEISGNTIVIGADRDAIGANNNQGSAYVFTRSGMVWTQRQKLEAADGAAGDIFGCSIAISGSHVIAGARWDDVNDTADQGSAYVFRVLGGNWSQETFATASDGAAGDGFGANVAISGDTAIVGASEDDVAGNSNQGAAYVFVRSGTAWIQQQKLLAGDGAAVDHFGISVAISGDTAVVGAHQDNVGANFNQGSAYVFVRSGSLWTAQQQLLATDGSSGDGFGSSVAISGQTAVVGALHDDVSGVTNQGSAYVFARTDTGWTQQLRLTAPDGAAGDFFGSSVAISGDVIVAGARGDDVGTNTDRGSAYVFVRSGNTWAPPQKVVASDGAAEDEFGSAVAISGETV
ncbi:MAG TPA: hypothetical protein VIQ24_24210, partial [Pyrinomonadaceae bacterium]